MDELTNRDRLVQPLSHDGFSDAIAELTRSMVSFDSMEALGGALERFGHQIHSDSVHLLEHVPVEGTSGFFWQQVGWTTGSGRFSLHDPMLQEVPVDQALPHMYAETAGNGYSLMSASSSPLPESLTLPSMRVETLLTVRLDSGDRLWGSLAIGWREGGSTLSGAEIEFLRHSIAPLGILIERSQGAAAIQLSLDRYRMLTESMKDVVWILDVEQMAFTYVSPSVLGLRGFSHLEVILDGVQASMAPEDLAAVQALARDGIARFRRGEPVPTEFVAVELRQPCKDGSWVWTEAITRFHVNERSGRLEVVGVSRDISERKRLEEALRREATTDDLTGLPNRREFMRIAEEEIARSRRYGHELVLCFFDLDDLKAVNDRLGHAAGDAALKHFAANLARHTRSTDTAARLSGDEFALLLPETDVPGAESTLCRIAAYSLDEPLSLDGESLSVTAASGLAVLQDADTGIDALLARADAALYDAKQCAE